MPWPMRPSPHTPTFLISISLLPFRFRAPGDYMGVVATEDRGPVRHIVMMRSEKRNAINDQMVLGLHEAFSAAADDDSVHVVVVRGDGPMFSSGMDIAGLSDLSDSPDNLRAFRRPIIQTWNLLEEMLKPTIAQIQ